MAIQCIDCNWVSELNWNVLWQSSGGFALREICRFAPQVVDVAGQMKSRR
jgi:hypothetical protein